VAGPGAGHPPAPPPLVRAGLAQRPRGSRRGRPSCRSAKVSARITCVWSPHGVPGGAPLPVAVDTQRLRQHGRHREPADHSALHGRTSEALTWPSAWRASARRSAFARRSRSTASPPGTVATSRSRAPRAGSRTAGHPRHMYRVRGHPAPTAPTAPTSSKTCWRAWTTPIKHSSGAGRAGRKRASHAARAAAASTPSPSRRTATGRGGTAAAWCARVSDASACSGPVRLRFRPRPSPSRVQRTAGTGRSPVPLPRCRGPAAPHRAKDRHGSGALISQFGLTSLGDTG
jgi:hypothetical protein